jgi:hypothetical protein
VLYQRIAPNAPLLTYLGPRPFAAVVAIEENVDPEWQWQMSKWLVESGCLYMMAWGIDCSSWDDSVDYANLEIYNYGDIPKDKHVMTTWHDTQPLEEVFDFAKRHARPMSDEIQIRETIVFHVACVDRQEQYERLFAAA